MNILIIVGGTNEPSNSHALANAFAQGMQQLGSVHVHTRCLKDLKIDHFTIDFYDAHCKQEEDFCELQARMEEAAGVVVASPIWNFGVPGHLKNFFDRMGSFALDETRTTGTLNGKPFYVIFTGGAPAAAWTGLMKKTTSFLPESIKYFGGSVIGTHYEPKCTQGKGKFGLVVDERPESIASLRKQGYEFATICKAYEETGTLPLKHKTTKKIYSWAQSVLKKIS